MLTVVSGGMAACAAAEERGADATSLRFAAAVRRCPSLVAVLAGHIHDATAQPLSEDGCVVVAAGGEIIFMHLLCCLYIPSVALGLSIPEKAGGMKMNAPRTARRLVQYTVDAGCYGACRILDFVPAGANFSRL
jgi:hypothetical protein